MLNRLILSMLVTTRHLIIQTFYSNMLPNVYHVMSEEIHICNLFISQVVRFT